MIKINIEMLMNFIRFNIFLVLLTIINGTRIKRIVGGNQIDIEKVPFMIALEYKKIQICGGAILNKDWVLTAAHCFGVVFDIEKALVRSASDVQYTGGKEHSILVIFKYPNFNITIVDNDTALMQISPPLEFSEKVAPINLATPGKRPNVGDMLTVLGWGYTEEKGQPSERLRGVSVPVFPHEECKEIYNETLIVTRQMICLGFENGGQDACIRDSGGPLIANNTLYGVVSWGWGCARPRHPGVYTDLTTPHLLDWIKNVITYRFIPKE